MEDGDKRILPLAEVETRIEARRALCEVAVPYVQTLYDFIKGSEFKVLLSDEEGYILYEQGDPEIMEIAKRGGLVKGACRSEQRLGTNGIGTVLVNRRPLQVFGAEHYYETHNHWACSGAPILLPDGSLGGSICLSGMAEKVTDHTLGMVVAAADAITRQLKLKSAYDELALAWKNLDLIIETVPKAICLLDTHLQVKAFNAQATKLLDALPKEIEGADFRSLLGGTLTGEELRQGLVHRSVTFERGKSKHHISLSIQVTENHEYVVQMEYLANLHRRVNIIVGNDAYFSFRDIIGTSPAIQQAVQIAKIAAENDATVFLAGESGTGKELFAQSIHNGSKRKNGPFIAVNCGALPKSLIEAELFGYESGSFTGAKREGCPGKFELANGGTIFLDEIGDMPFDVQATLLRVLQNREVRRIGASKTTKIDVRIITATNQNLEQLVANKAFREDLFYRINVFHIRIPPLRERVGDVKILAEFFLQKYSAGALTTKISDEALTQLEQYSWPGNVRQLENTIEREVYLAPAGEITANALTLELWGASTPREVPHPTLEHILPSTLSIRKNERQQIEQALEGTSGNVKQAAELLEISRRTLYRKIQQYGIDCDAYRS